jgi:hypothetical protein
VPEEFLDDPQVGATIEEVGGEAVAQGVGVGGNRRTVVEEPPDISWSEPPADPIQEHGLRRGLGAAEVGPPHRPSTVPPPERSGRASGPAARGSPCPRRSPSCPGGRYRRRRARTARPPAGRTRTGVRGRRRRVSGWPHRRHHPLPRGGSPGRLQRSPSPSLARPGTVEHGLDLAAVENAWQAGASTGRRQTTGRIDGGGTPLHGPREVTAQGSSLPRHGGPRMTPRGQIRQIAAKKQAVNLSRSRDTAAPGPLDESAEIAGVGAHGLRRQTTQGPRERIDVPGHGSHVTCGRTARELSSGPGGGATRYRVAGTLVGRSHPGTGTWTR